MIDKKYVKTNLRKKILERNILLSNNSVRVCFVPFYCAKGKKILEIHSVDIVILFWFICLFDSKPHTVAQADLELPV